MEKNTDQFNSIKFKPMSEGLGLNHFADGLPYTPNHSKKRPTMNFAFPPPRAPRASQPERESMPMPDDLMPAMVGTERARQMVERFDAETSEATDAGTETTSAGFLRRIVAYCLDIVFSTAMFFAIVWVSFAVNGYDLMALLSEHRGVQIFWPLALLYGVVHMGYFLIQETTWRRTLGKAIMGIRIRSSSGFATLGRSVCFLVATMPFGVGLFWYFFDSRHRCWHDVITDSEVVLG